MLGHPTCDLTLSFEPAPASHTHPWQDPAQAVLFLPQALGVIFCSSHTEHAKISVSPALQGP